MSSNLKNLKNIVGNLAPRFSGDAFMFNLRTMAKLGTGSVVIDVLSQTCMLNGTDIPLPQFARDVIDWCEQQIRTAGVAREDILSIVFTCEIAQRVIDARERSVRNVQFYGPGGVEIVSGEFLRFDLTCRTDIVTALRFGEYAFTRHYKTTNEYPRSFLLNRDFA
jgi:hypothetical protein